MSGLSLDKLNPVAKKIITPFLNEVLDGYREKIHSIHITGTAVTGDFNEKMSDVNSIIVLKEMDLRFLELLAPLGKKYGRKRVAAPLIMTTEYINGSLDVFPIEFLNFKLIHLTVYGEDVFENIEIDRMDLRHQCERELKSKLIWLRQGYISSQGDKKILTERFVSSITDYMPLFRGIMVLFGKEPPLAQGEVITALSDAVNADTGVFAKVLKEKREKIKLSMEELNTIFEDYYSATEKLGKIVDEINE
jgi:hypothetical protein